MYNIFLSTKVHAAKNIHGREITYFCEKKFPIDVSTWPSALKSRNRSELICSVYKVLPVEPDYVAKFINYFTRIKPYLSLSCYVSMNEIIMMIPYSTSLGMCLSSQDLQKQYTIISEPNDTFYLSNSTLNMRKSWFI